jgi:predicted  nucleic acid-binding Zn-ribbon protein
MVDHYFLLDGEPIMPKNEFDRLLRRLEESEAKIEHQGAIIDQMQMAHSQAIAELTADFRNKTEASIDRMTAQISALVASLSRDPKP